MDWTQYTDEELSQFPQEIWAEQQRRNTLATAQQTINDTNKAYLNAAGQTSGKPWVKPTGAHDAYPLDWVVTHEDKTWMSLINGTVFEPGVSSWREQAQGDEWPDWVQPTGGHDAYPKGAQVSHQDKHWISEIDANVWEPGSVGAETLWTEQS